jgi:hypothetical protein
MLNNQTDLKASKWTKLQASEGSQVRNWRRKGSSKILVIPLPIVQFLINARTFQILYWKILQRGDAVCSPCTKNTSRFPITGTVSYSANYIRRALWDIPTWRETEYGAFDAVPSTAVGWSVIGYTDRPTKIQIDWQGCWTVWLGIHTTSWWATGWKQIRSKITVHTYFVNKFDFICSNSWIKSINIITMTSNWESW